MQYEIAINQNLPLLNIFAKNVNVLGMQIMYL